MNTRIQLILALVIVALAVGTVFVFALGGQTQEDPGGDMAGHDHSTMAAGGDDAQPVTLTQEDARRIGVTFATVTRGTLPRTISTVGSVTYDETRLTDVSPKVEGWVERLHVDFTGALVRAGQPLLDVYSPALVTAQEELFLAKDLVAQASQAGNPRGMAKAETLLAAARRRLAYWDIPEEEIYAMEERGTPTKTLTLQAPAQGVVVKKSVVEGARIHPGATIFRLADLSRVWVEAQVFEKDLSRVEVGQHAMVSFEAYPGETFHGSVTYVYPAVSPSTRTGRVRLELPNPGLTIKPGMYARADLHGGSVNETLLVPRSAVLQTGERSLVFHRMDNGQLHPMEVVTGLASGNQIQILSGLQEGHVVVTSATFLIDAEANLGAAMAGMAGMDHAMMDMAAPEEVDHSQHDMPGMAQDSSGQETLDHSQHQMPTMAPDTGGSGERDHSHHDMGGGGR